MMKTEFIELERPEKEYWGKFYSHANKREFQGALACSLPEIDVLAYNRVVGLNHDFSFEKENLEEIIKFFENKKVKRFMLQVPPYLLNEQRNESLVSMGFRPHNYWSKLYGDIPKLQKFSMEGNLTSIEIGKEKSAVFADVILKAFDWPELLRSFIADSVGLPGYFHYLVLEGKRPIAAGALHIFEDMASLALAGTLPEFRKKGAQQALLNIRIQKAAKLSCRYIVSETGKDSETHPNISYRNMRKFGLEKSYDRRNYVFEF